MMNGWREGEDELGRCIKYPARILSVRLSNSFSRVDSRQTAAPPFRVHSTPGLFRHSDVQTRIDAMQAAANVAGKIDATLADVLSSCSRFPRP